MASPGGERPAAVFEGGAPTPILPPYPGHPRGVVSFFRVSICLFEEHGHGDTLYKAMRLLGGHGAGVRRWECAGVQVGYPLPAGTTHGARFPRRGRTRDCHKPSALALLSVV